MHARDETILFSAIAILLAALGLGGAADLASTDARAASNTRELQVSRSVSSWRELHASGDACTPIGAAPAVRSGAEQRG
jgi:hypothetical protein